MRHRIGTDGGLQLHRSASDRRALQRQTFEKCQCRSDFVLLGLDDEVADNGRQSGRERRDDVQRFGIKRGKWRRGKWLSGN